MPVRRSNIRAYKQLLQIIDDEKIEAVTCSTPIGGFLGRIAAKVKGISPVVYAAHGFLFFEGAPLINRTVYKWEEVLLAHWTDALITINEEDHRAAQKLKTRSGGKPYMIHGAGVAVGVQVNVDRTRKRQELGVPEEAFLVVSAGDLVKYKNNGTIIEAIARTGDPDIHYILCGIGEKRQEWETLAQRLGIAERIHFLGYRTDVAEIMACSDVFAMPSIVEGVPRALLEAMDQGLACVGSDTRGIRELLGKNEGGFLYAWKDADGFAEALKVLKADEKLCSQMGERNRLSVRAYSSEVVQEELYQIYKRELCGDSSKHPGQEVRR